jgi:CrcB protein
MWRTTILAVKLTPFDLRRLAAIYAGGVLGALARVGLAEAAPHGPGEWPWATFAVNMVGALLLGLFFARLRDHPEDSLAHPFLTIGICGTLTTFSAIQLELFELVEAGHLGLAAAYVGATLAAGYAFVRLGIALERRMATYPPKSAGKSPVGPR